MRPVSMPAPAPGGGYAYNAPALGSYPLLFPHPRVCLCFPHSDPFISPTLSPPPWCLRHPCLSQEDESPRSVLEEMGLA